MDIQNNEVGTRNEKQVYKLDMLYNDDIERAIRQTRHYKRDIFDVNYEKPVASKAGRISIQNMTTKEAIFEYASNSKTIAALNLLHIRNLVAVSLLIIKVRKNHSVKRARYIMYLVHSLMNIMCLTE